MLSHKWDVRFLDLADHVAAWSKDRGRKVGCVIVDDDRNVRAMGYNGFPRGVDDEVEERHARPAKYLWTEHAERNAIMSAARVGVPLQGCTAYVPWFPCMDCARALIQSGIVSIVCGMAMSEIVNDPVWGENMANVEIMVQEAGVNLRYCLR